VVISHKLFFNNTKFIQDQTGAIELSDPNGIIKTGLNIGDGLTGLMGLLEDFYGQLQLIPVENIPAASSKENSVTVAQVSLKQLNSNVNFYESKLCRTTTVRFELPDSSFRNGTNYRIFAGNDTGVFSTVFYDADYIGAQIPDSAKLTGIIVDYKGTAKFVARSKADIDTYWPVSTKQKSDLGLNTIYPNPFSDILFINSPSGSVYQLRDISGRLWLEGTLQGTEPISTTSLQPGLYLITVRTPKAWISHKLIKY